MKTTLKELELQVYAPELIERIYALGKKIESMKKHLSNAKKLASRYKHRYVIGSVQLASAILNNDQKVIKSYSAFLHETHKSFVEEKFAIKHIQKEIFKLKNDNKVLFQQLVEDVAKSQTTKPDFRYVNFVLTRQQALTLLKTIADDLKANPTKQNFPVTIKLPI